MPKIGDKFMGRDFTPDERKKLAKSGAALPDGSYPIENAKDLKDAISAYGRNPTARVKAHITKRAKALSKTDMLPTDWPGSTKKAADVTPGDVHVPGLLKRKMSAAYVRKLIEKIKKSGRFTSDEWDEMMREARSHAGGKERGARAQKADEPESDLEMQLEAETEDETETGVMVAFYLDPETASELAVEGGEPPEELHVTLAYLGDASQYSQLTLARILTTAEDMARYQLPVVGEVSGTGCFTADDDGDVYYASVDVPGLEDYRQQLVSRLRLAGARVSDEHGFDPHVTLYYAEKGEQVSLGDPGGTALRFGSLSVCAGESRVDIPLTGAGLLAYADIADLCSDGNESRLFNEVSFAEPPEWIPYLPKPGSYKHPNYGEIKLTPARIRNFVENFKAGVYQERLPVDAEHETKLSGAVGWITDMRVNPDGSADARVEWTDRGESLIESDRFRYFSPEWFNSWTDPATETTHKDVAVGGAICTRPFFKEKHLRPLVASARGLEATDVEPDGLASTQTIHFTALAPVKEEMTDMATNADNKDKTATGAAAPDPTDAQRFAEMESALKAAETRAEAAEAESKKAGERIATLEREGRARRFTAIIRDTEGDGSKRFVGDEKAHLSFMEKLAEAFGETSDEVNHYVTEQRSHAERVRQSGLFNEKGRGGSGAGDSAGAQVAARVAALREKDPQLSVSDAQQLVFVENPSLYEAYRAETQVKV